MHDKMAMNFLNQPKKIHVSLDGNNEAMWTCFKEDFDFFMLSAGFKDKSNTEKVALLINTGGTALKEIYKTLELSGKTYDQVLTALDGYFNVQKNQLSARKIFSTLAQKQEENIDQFITHIKCKAAECDFGDDEKKTQMRDRLLFGCREDELREKFFRIKYDELTYSNMYCVSIS